ncbi:MAG: IS1634 family transposase [Gammaproteobacteria bacterium]
MYIRRTTIKSRHDAQPYFTYRLVESVRDGSAVRERTLLNLGRHFDVPREQWAALAQRIEQLISGQSELVPLALEPQWEPLAQRYSAALIRAKARLDESEAPKPADYQTVDGNSLDWVRARSVGVEHVGLTAVRQLGLDTKLEQLGFNGPQQAAALGTLIGRLAAPGSERATHDWLQSQSALGELIGYDFATLSLEQLYRISDRLLQHKNALEGFLYRREQSLFAFDEVITLYDLTNTYFEGSATANTQAAFGRSKEKRSDCRLVTLALVLDSSGFPKRSTVFAGNASEPKTLAQMLGELSDTQAAHPPTVVLDAGLATEANIAWLKDHHYRYLVVSRARHREFNADEAVRVRNEGELGIEVQRVVDADTGEVKLYCHSSQREKKEQGMQPLFSERYEAELAKLAAGLAKKGTVTRSDKVLERLGRLKQKYAGAAQHYDITVEHDKVRERATALHWARKPTSADTLAGVYCLCTNQKTWDETTLWHTDTMLTDLEAVFRSLKSELGLRPVFHHNTERVSGHLFISVLAYHLVHTIRFQLKACGIHLSWESLRQTLAGQVRVTVELKREDGKTLHVRKTTRPEPRQQVIYDALGIFDRPGKTETTII